MSDENEVVPWVPFFFEGNLFFGRIEEPEEWDELRAAYSDMTDDQLLDAKFATYGGSTDQAERRVKKYGFRHECDGERTLRDHFTEHGMTVPPKTSVKKES